MHQKTKINEKKKAKDMKKVVIGIIMIFQVAVSLDLITTNTSSEESMGRAEIAAKSCNTSNYIEISDFNELETYVCTNK